MPPPEVSVVVLCYRAGEALRNVVEPLVRQLTDARLEYELVLVANYWPGTDDATPAVAREYEGRRVVVLAEPKQGGMGWDMRCGFRAARGDAMVVLDGDDQNPTEDVLRAYRLLRDSGADLVKGVRIARFDGLHRRLISVVYNFLFRAVFGTQGLWDINGKPKALTREAYGRIDLRSSDWFVDAEIVLEALGHGMTVRELPVVFRRNDERPSFVKVATAIEFLRNIAAYRARRWR